MAAPLEDGNLQNILNLFLLDDQIDDELLLLLLEITETRESTYDPTWPKLDLDDLSREQCLKLFRFDQEDIGWLVRKLGLPNRITLPSRNVVSGYEGLCMLLRRLAYPNRLFDLEKLFGRPTSTLSLAINKMVDILYENHSHRLIDLQQPWITERLQNYADTIHIDKNAPLENCFAFVDGTVRPICRPMLFQRVCYNGHKRVHSIKFQSLVTPDGMIANLYGPIEGRRHDCALLRYSELLDKLENLPQRDRNGRRFSIYGDPAYPLREQLLAPYRGGQLTDLEELFNYRMSSVRECVEWTFGKILQEFAFLDFRKNLKVFLQPVAKYYAVGALFTNCHTCIYESTTGHYFGLSAPSLDEYLG